MIEIVRRRGRYNRCWMVKIIRYCFSTILIILSLLALIWGTLPAKRQEVIKEVSPEEMRIIQEGQVMAGGLKESRLVKLSIPESLRIGDVGVIEIEFIPLDDRKQHFPPETTGDGEKKSSNVMAEARIEMAEVRTNPSNIIRESMPAGEALRFRWKISADKVTIYDGRVWLSLRYLPIDGSEAIQVPVFVTDVQVISKSLFGLTGRLSRLVGVIGMVVGIFIISGDMIHSFAIHKKKTKMMEGMNY